MSQKLNAAIAVRQPCRKSALPSENRQCSVRLACPKRANGLNRSRGRALRHGRATNGWNDESVLPDVDEGSEACLQNR